MMQTNVFDDQPRAADQAGAALVAQLASLIAAQATNKPFPRRTARDVLGYEPRNRHDRRNAARLLRSKAERLLRSKR